MLKSGVYTKIKRKGFQDKIREYAVAHNVRCLPKIMLIEDRVIDHLLKKPLEARKHIRMLAEKKRIGGILAQEPQQSVRQSISINQVRLFWAQVLDDADEPVEDAEIGEDNNKE